MLKKLLSTVFLTATLLLPSFAFSDETVTNDIVYSSNVLGLLPVTSSAKRTLIAVPWCAMSETNNLPINVSNIVKTANLSVGDSLHYVSSSGSYHSWYIAESGGVKYWAAAKEAGETSTDTAPDPALTTIDRGNSLVLIRTNPTTGESATPFYVFGQVPTNGTVTTTIAKGSATTPAYSLIASPKREGWNLNDDASWSGVGSDDEIYLPGTTGFTQLLKWNGTKWCYLKDTYKTIGNRKIRTGTELVEYETDIPAGLGLWYLSYGGQPTVTWK